METVHFLLTIFSILMNTGKEEPLYTIVMISLVQFRFISCGLRLALPTIFAKEYLHVSFCLHSFALYANRCFEFCAVPFYFITFEHVTLNFQASRILSISSNLLLLTGQRLRNSQVFYFFFHFSFDSFDFFFHWEKNFEKASLRFISRQNREGFVSNLSMNFHLFLKISIRPQLDQKIRQKC